MQIKAKLTVTGVENVEIKYAFRYVVTNRYFSITFQILLCQLSTIFGKRLKVFVKNFTLLVIYI